MLSHTPWRGEKQLLMARGRPPLKRGRPNTYVYVYVCISLSIYLYIYIYMYIYIYI